MNPEPESAAAQTSYQDSYAAAKNATHTPKEKRNAASSSASRSQWTLWLLTVCAFSAIVFSLFDAGTDFKTWGLQSVPERRTPTEKIHLKTIPFGRFSTVFNDKNDKHIAAAETIGITPATSREEALRGKRKLREISSCRYFTLDPLTHSIPFLVPQAEELLNTIGNRFNQLQEERGAGGYRMIVTSVLRVNEDIKKLRRGNSNASSNSAHRYGTTFDIAYNRFDDVDNPYLVSAGELKHLLGEVLLSLKKENACFVKYEIKQGCFHITAR